MYYIIIVIIIIVLYYYRDCNHYTLINTHNFGILGGKFWRTSKIIRAVSLRDYQQIELQRNPPSKFSSIVTLSDSDSDFERSPVAVKRRKPLSLERTSYGPTSAEPFWLPKLTETWEKVAIMSAESTQQLCEIQSLREMVKHQAQMTLVSIAGIFTCIICKSTMKANTNLLVAPCCQAALACRECLKEWLRSSDNHTCPNCRESVEVHWYDYQKCPHTQAHPLLVFQVG